MVIAETRRIWSLAEKRAIVVEASAPGVNVSEIARRHGMKPSLLFRWKTQLADATEGSIEPADIGNGRSPSFVPVVLPAPAAGVASTGGGGGSYTFPVPLKVTTAGNALYAANVTTSSSTKISCSGFKSTVSY